MCSFSPIPTSLLHVHMKAIAHANNLPLTLAFQVIFIRASVNFFVGTGPGMPGVATPLIVQVKTCLLKIERLYQFILHNAHRHTRLLHIYDFVFLHR